MRKMKLLVIAVAVASLLLPLAGVAAARADEPGAASSLNRALDYLKGRQQSDGGFAEPGGGSSEQLTSWVVCAVAACGQDAATWRKSGKTPLDYLARRAGNTSKLTDLEKDCLAVSSAGANPRSFGGRDLVAAIKSRMGADGHIGDLVNEHCWGLIALAAAGEQGLDSSRAWLEARQNIDGGFGYATDSGSDPDDTGAALQALVASGDNGRSNSVVRALSYLQFCQAPDGGFSWQTDGSNVGSTAWCVQGLCAAGDDPASDKWKRSGKTPLDFLSKMQQGDGHYKYTNSADSNPAWMTAEAIPAVLKKAFPIKAETAPVKARTTPTNTNSPTTANTVNTSQAAPAASSAQASAPGQAAAGDSNSATSKGTAPGGVQARADARRLNVIAASSQEKTGRGLAFFLVLCGLYLLLVGLIYMSLRLFVT